MFSTHKQLILVIKNDFLIFKFGYFDTKKQNLLDTMVGLKICMGERVCNGSWDGIVLINLGQC
jgi:hypothetical protein